VSSAIFCDTTVLCNFAVIGRVDLLELILRDRGRWTEAVAYEVEQSRGHLPDLARVLAGGWLGEPIGAAENDAEAWQIERIRRSVFGGLADQPTKHLGEAETVFLIKNRVELRGAWWVTDDRAAVVYGRAQDLITMETADLIADAVAMTDLTAEFGFDLLVRMQEYGRFVQLPGKPADLIR
jgi:predicted nucleic acid-binding protein